MKKPLILVPIFFLAALIAIGGMLYIRTEERTGCTGAACDESNDAEFVDLVLKARTK